MPDPEKKEPTPPEKPGQGDDPKPPEKPESPDPKKPDKPDGGDGQGKDVVSKKQYDELRTDYTKKAQKLSEYEKRIADLEEQAKPKKPEPKDKKPTLEEQLEKTKTVRTKAIEEGYDTTLYDNQILMLENEISQKTIAQHQQKVRSNFDSFLNHKNGETGDYDYMKELDAGLYTYQDLNDVVEKVKKETGFTIDFESARSRILADNMAKYQEYDKKRREAADNASSPDGEAPDAKKPDPEKELGEQLFPDMNWK